MLYSLKNIALFLVISFASSLYPSELLITPVNPVDDYCATQEFYDETENDTDYHTPDVRYEISEAARARSSRMRHAVHAGAKIGAIFGLVVSIIAVITKTIPFLMVPIIPLHIPLYILGAIAFIAFSVTWNAAVWAGTSALIMHSTNKRIARDQECSQ